ncbi:MAG: 16S rRNA (cytosine(1402)-N(4))-methyltransferase RsmH [Gammaproteobacteria bacterium]
MNEYGHIPVLVEEVVNGLKLRPDGFYVDGTFGRGGHSRAILSRLDSDGRLLVFDRDPEAVARARRLAEEEPRLDCVHGGFSSLRRELETRGRCGQVDGVLLDLGVSSPQLDDSRRGFSFSREGDLDMRMDPGVGVSAAQWINQAAEGDIADVLYRYGEERHARRIARAIVRARAGRPITGTLQLAEIITAANPSREKGKHPATRSFQGIRIFINDELEDLRQGLAGAFHCLRVGGRLAVISFHSLEDRMVKRFMRDLAHYDPYPKELPVRAEAVRPLLKVIGKPVTPGPGEIEANPRARSARLRIAEKLAA